MCSLVRAFTFISFLLLARLNTDICILCYFTLCFVLFFFASWLYFVHHTHRQDTLTEFGYKLRLRVSTTLPHFIQQKKTNSSFCMLNLNRTYEVTRNFCLHTDSLLFVDYEFTTQTKYSILHKIQYPKQRKRTPSQNDNIS